MFFKVMPSGDFFSIRILYPLIPLLNRPSFNLNDGLEWVISNNMDCIFKLAHGNMLFENTNAVKLINMENTMSGRIIFCKESPADFMAANS